VLSGGRDSQKRDIADVWRKAPEASNRHDHLKADAGAVCFADDRRCEHMGSP
jgi:hypothetical protein